MAASILTIANQKGGVGKTTTAINLGSALAALDVKTLLIDLDPQANLTSGLGMEKIAGQSIYDALHGEGQAIDKIVPTSIENLSVIPSEIDLAAIEIELSRRDDYLIQLRRCLEPIRSAPEYQLVMVDCPPALGLLSMNGLAAADSLLITLQCEYLAMEGLGQILDIADRLRDARVNPTLELGGILMTMFDVRTNLSRQVADEVRDHFGELVFRTIIPRTVRLGEAPSFGQPIIQYDRSNAGAIAYRNLAREVVQRFDLS